MADSFTFLSFFLLSLVLLSHLSLPVPVVEPTFNLSIAPEPNPSCHPFDCGNLTEIKYPFFDITNHGCRLLWAINCENGMKPTIKFEDEGRSYVVKNILYEESTLVIQDEEISNHSPSALCNFHYNFTMPPSPLHPLYLKTPNYTFVNCKGDHQPLFNDSYKGVYNYRGCEDRIIYYWPEDLQLHHLSSLQLRHCSVTHFPLSLYLVDPDVPKDLFSLLDLGFDLLWNRTRECTECQKGKGVCTPNTSTGGFDCFRTPPWLFPTRPAQPPRSNNPPEPNPAPNSDKPEKVHSGEKRTKKKKILIAVGAVIGGFLLTSLILILRSGFLFLLIRTKNWKKKSDNAGNVGGVEEFLEIYGSLALRRYTYSDLKKITNSFKDSLGQGGYGGVFKGMLQDGRLVAVKVLNESKGNGEDFINEVSSIGRTYHVNIVSLLGFCSEGSKRALIYEFMPNGSLEKFIYTEKPRQSHPLGWEKLYQIAIGVARGLEYLHRGCNTRILHFDIKPHNILLDQDFCPKISDFGLAKLCPTQNSTISMLGTRGTVGYIAPEVYCRNIGGVSYKSDVYSYGMMVLEMVGGRKNIDPLVENTSEVYFPHWIYNRLTTYRHLDLHGYLGLHGIETKVEEETARKMILVGLWCIQTNPTDRPSMSRVVEMLEGSLNGLPMPPQPFLSSSS